VTTPLPAVLVLLIIELIVMSKFLCEMVTYHV
jgi:hypothetical protein